MKKLFTLFLAAVALLSLAACGGAQEETGPYVALTDVAAEAVPADELAPADVNEVAVATEEMLLNQPMDTPLQQPIGPASDDPSAEPAGEAETPADDTAQEQ